MPSTHLLWLLDAVDRRDHAVTDTDMEVGLIADQGTYRAVCGHRARLLDAHPPARGAPPATSGWPYPARADIADDSERIVRCTLGEMMSAFRTSTSRPRDTGRKPT